jgi:hypothetical protein
MKVKWQRSEEWRFYGCSEGCRSLIEAGVGVYEQRRSVCVHRDRGGLDEARSLQ